ncbi:MAG: DinB family protein, partial [Ferruginibacter sp.]
MQTQTSVNEITPDKELFIKMVLDAWGSHNARFNKLFDELPDEQLLSEVSPGKNSGIYLAGHLVAINDAMLPILGFGEKLYPQLEEIFIAKPDKSGLELPSVNELKKYRDEINAKLIFHIGRLQAKEWFTRHAVVSKEDFAKEPHRNKLNILINRTNHLSYHLGQLALLVECSLIWALCAFRCIVCESICLGAKDQRVLTRSHLVHASR